MSVRLSVTRFVNMILKWINRFSGKEMKRSTSGVRRSKIHVTGGQEVKGPRHRGSGGQRSTSQDKFKQVNMIFWKWINRVCYKLAQLVHGVKRHYSRLLRLSRFPSSSIETITDAIPHTTNTGITEEVTPNSHNKKIKTKKNEYSQQKIMLSKCAAGSSVLHR